MSKVCLWKWLSDDLASACELLWSGGRRVIWNQRDSSNIRGRWVWLTTMQRTEGSSRSLRCGFMIYAFLCNLVHLGTVFCVHLFLQTKSHISKCKFILRSNCSLILILKWINDFKRIIAELIIFCRLGSINFNFTAEETNSERLNILLKLLFKKRHATLLGPAPYFLT